MSPKTRSVSQCYDVEAATLLVDHDVYCICSTMHMRQNVQLIIHGLFPLGSSDLLGGELIFESVSESPLPQVAQPTIAAEVQAAS